MVQIGSFIGYVSAWEADFQYSEDQIIINYKQLNDQWEKEATRGFVKNLVHYHGCVCAGLPSPQAPLQIANMGGPVVMLPRAFELWQQ